MNRTIEQMRERHARLLKTNTEENKLMNLSTLVSIPTRVIVIPTLSDGASKISESILQKNFDHVNNCFQKLNNQTNAPSSGHHNFASLLGNPGVRFVPSATDGSTTGILSEANGSLQYLPAKSGVFGGLITPEIESYAASNGVVMTTGVVYIVIANIGEDGTTLGIANQIGEEISKKPFCAIHYKSVGFPGHTSPFTDFAGYQEGMTWAHEIGHVTGLEHAFSGDGCTSVRATIVQSIHSNTPVQQVPNITHTLNDLLPDNASKDLDRKNNGIATRLSCLSDAQLNDPNQLFEGFVEIMDYSRDAAMQGFFSAPAAVIRSTVNASKAYYGATLSAVEEGTAGPSATGTGTSVSSIMGTSPSTAQDDDEETPVIATTDDDSSGGSDAFPIWAIIVIVVGVILVIGVGYYFMRRNGGSAKRSSGYTSQKQLIEEERW